MLQGMGLSSLKVGNSDAGSYFNNLVLAAVDFGVRALSLISLSPFVVSYTQVVDLLANYYFYYLCLDG